MTALHLLVYGETDSGVTDSIRIGMFRDALAALGVEVRTWSGFADDVINGAPPPQATDAIRGGGDLRATEALRVAGLTALAWADVLLFRRWRPTRIVCTECEADLETLVDLDSHLAATGHRTMRPDLLLRPIVEMLEAHREMLGSRTIVYDTDDDVLEYPAWTGFAAAAARERDVVARIMNLADLVTAATPVLAERLAGRTAAPVLVVRNAVEPRWYETGGLEASGEVAARPPAAGTASDGVRVVYHGVPARLRDYEVARGAVDQVSREFPSLRRVWIGAAGEPRVVAAVDESLPWVEGVREFARALVVARPDIGLGPLLDEPFNRAKSELHWLEYAMAGAPAILSGLAGAGPYDVVRDGVDGLVARTPDDWLRHLRALAASRDLRSELAGRAKERVLSEYSVSARAPEWAGAFRWAAEHPRSSRGVRPVIVPGADLGPPVPPAAAAPAEVGTPATPSLRVLVIGPGAASASDALRFDAVAPSLARRGVELRSWSPAADAADTANSDDEFAELERALGWAGVVVLRRSYRTYHACSACAARTGDRAEIREHARLTGHDVVESPFAVVRPLVGLLEAEPTALGGRPLVYETDDDIFSADLPPGAEDLLERDLVGRILALATLVTTTTPVLAGRLAARTRAPIRVIRNAVDPVWYESAPSPDPSLTPGDPRVVYHGVKGRIRDYELARPALDALIAGHPGVRRVWLGSTAPEVAALVDEVRPWVAGLPAFAASLVAAAPHIGLAPIEDSLYNRARSELHWIEYAMAGAPSVVSGFDGAGPYDAIRDGVDGLVARTPQDWLRHLETLVASRDLRAEIAGRARERVLAEYTVERRAAEWADAYRWSAEHA